jgi:palmitoyltransferase
LVLQAVQGIPLKTSGLIHGIIFNSLCFLAIASHIRGAFADPGRIPKGMEAPFKSEFMEIKDCSKCEDGKTWKPARAHHCTECGFCVFKMDHHCPWINNCVGQRNYKYFCQFVIYILLSSAYLSILMFLSFYNLLTAEKTKIHMNRPGYPVAFIMCIIAFVEGILFAFFTYEILTEQFESVDENQSYIDQLKKQYGRQGELYENAQSYFGLDVMWWLVPTHPELRINYLERVWPKKAVQRMI